MTNIFYKIHNVEVDLLDVVFYISQYPAQMAPLVICRTTMPVS